MIGPVTMGYFLVSHSYNMGWILVAALCAVAGIILISAYKIDISADNRA